MILREPSEIRALLGRIHTVAVVGASPNALRPSYTVFSYLRTQTPYDVVPINPAAGNIDGIPAFASLEEYVRERGAPDIVNVFRSPVHLPGVAAEAIAAGAKAIWFQYGAVNPIAVDAAEAAGLDVVVDRCLKVEYARFSGALATAGVNSGIIGSRRRP